MIARDAVTVRSVVSGKLVSGLTVSQITDEDASLALLDSESSDRRPEYARDRVAAGAVDDPEAD